MKVTDENVLDHNSGEGRGEAMDGGSSAMRQTCRPAAAHAAGIGPTRVLRALVACAAMTLALVLAAGAPAQAQEPEPLKVLLFHGATDATTQPGIDAFEAIEAGDDFVVDSTGDAADINADNLAEYRTVVFLNTAGDLLDDEQEAALTGYIEDGGGFLGIGSAAQSEPGTDFFNGLIGARPSSGSSTTPAEMTVAVGDRVHPATRDLDLEWDRTDVWYQWQSRPTGQVHTVARYHATNAPAGDGTSVGGTDQPISWCRDYRGGRSFYTGMGRTAGAFGEAGFRTHLAGALRWTTGLERANCKATITSNYEGKKIVAAASPAVGLANSGESHGLVTAPNGWVLYIGRGDCRTDEERGEPARHGLARPRLRPRGRERRHRLRLRPRLGSRGGRRHAQQRHHRGRQARRLRRRRPGRRAHGRGRPQDGVRPARHHGRAGLRDDRPHLPAVLPVVQPGRARPPGLPESRRISKMSEPRISRFTIDLATKQLDLDSEVVIFEYDAQIYSCCHVGGGMGFDSEGNLYVTTGDTNSSQGSNGYSGNNPTAKCPTGPNDEPSSAHCGTAGYSYQDARRTAGNTNDYNGKMLRFRPNPDSAGRLRRGTAAPDSTYTLPTDESPNGPEPVQRRPRANGGTGQARDLRHGPAQPVAPVRRSGDGRPVHGLGRPRRRARRARRQGPSTYENAAQIDRAGNYGWPYCMGNGQAYRDRLADGQPADRPTRRATSPAARPPAAPTAGTTATTSTTTRRTTRAWWSCRTRPARAWTRASCATSTSGTAAATRATPTAARTSRVTRGENAAPNYGATPTQLCPYLINEGMTVMAGPVYRYDDDAADDSRRWPEYWDGRWFLHNNGGASVKHALLFDPATVDDGGQPVYADSFRDVLNWDAGYMDSKFGPDGALYVQVYDGFFRADQNVGIWRFDYTGGADDAGREPAARSRSAATASRFSSAGSGGISYEWDFGDGSADSTEANPMHQYADARATTPPR